MDNLEKCKRKVSPWPSPSPDPGSLGKPQTGLRRAGISLGRKPPRTNLKTLCRLHKGFTGCHTCIYRCQVEVACIDQSPGSPSASLRAYLWCEMYLVQCYGGAAYSGHGQTEKDRWVDRERVRWETSQTERRTGADAAGSHWGKPGAPERHGNIRFCRNEGESKCQGVLVCVESLRGIGIQDCVDCM